MTLLSDPKFVALRTAVQVRFDAMAEAGHNMYQSAIQKDTVWAHYMTIDKNAPKFRERTHHDCACCKSYIRNVGRVLFSVNGKLESIWDNLDVPQEYQEVVLLLAQANREAGIAGIYLNDEKQVGRKESYERLSDGTVHTWNHFEAILPERAFSLRGDVAARKGNVQTKEKALRRSIQELSSDAVRTVIELCEEDLILRSTQYLPMVKGLAAMQLECATVEDQNVYFWDKTVEFLEKGFEPNMRGTAIGTLIVDLTEGVEIEVAVKKYEDKTNGANYMRSTPLFSKRQKEDAQELAKREGFEPSFYRRHATKSDISVTDVLFADGTVAPFMADSAFDMLSPTKTKAPQNFDRVKEVGIEEFIEKILPNSEGLEVFLENKHESNLVSLVSAVHPDAPTILKWGNNTSWDYNGGFTDSVIKQRVAEKGGRVENVDTRISLAWAHRDDLDLHIDNSYGQHVYYGQYCHGAQSRDGFNLDVDMRGSKFEQVENTVCPSNAKLMPNTRLPITVHNFSENGTRSGDPARVEGFQIEIEILGEVHNIEYTKYVPDGATIEVGYLVVDEDRNVTLETTLACSSSVNPKEVWNVTTCDFVPVEMVMRSPNFWESANKGGNEHVFFMLKECKNPDPVRGFYNEYLTQEFRPHRKVFEMLGSMMKAPYADEQLSGIGFSKGQRNELVVRVKGETQRVYKVKF